MFGLGSRTYYAVSYKDGKPTLYNFESKMDRDYFVAHSKIAENIDAYSAMSLSVFLDKIQVPASSCLGENPERKKRIKDWYENKRHRI